MTLEFIIYEISGSQTCRLTSIEMVSFESVDLNVYPKKTQFLIFEVIIILSTISLNKIKQNNNNFRENRDLQFSFISKNYPWFSSTNYLLGH